MAHPREKRTAPGAAMEGINADLGAAEPSQKKARRNRQQTPEEQLAAAYRRKIELAAKDANAAAAVEAYEHMKASNLPINPYLYRVVINVCANDPSATDVQDAAFSVYKDLLAHLEGDSSASRADETVFSALVKICAQSKKFDKCLSLIGEMRDLKVAPRLRTYSSLLDAYADEGNLDKALWVRGELREHGIEMTEHEYIALFRACIQRQSHESFSSVLEEYLEMILQPGLGAWEVLKAWFASDAASEGGRKWVWSTETIDSDGISSETGQKLESIELLEDQRTALLDKIESLVMTDETRIEQWCAFKEWLAMHGPFDVILDAANIGYFNQNYSGGGFSYRQIDLMVKHYEAQGKKVLIVLHKRRTYDDVVPIEFHTMLKEWKERNIMYNCRSGNNDDWYWLYASVKLGGRTLIVSNDEMRDHHFQMIHTRSLVRWKERHQVHYSVQSEKYVRVQEPSIYSARPQRIGDAWHFPLATSPPKWMCFQLETATQE